MLSVVAESRRPSKQQQQQQVVFKERWSSFQSSSSSSSKLLFLLILFWLDAYVKVAAAFSHFKNFQRRQLSIKLTSECDSSSSSSSSDEENNGNDMLRPQLIRRVAIVGGTHGNEYTGVWCVKSLQSPLQQSELKRLYPSLDITTLISNLIAFEQNKRFVSSDLNREFSVKKPLATLPKDCNHVEALRAREISDLLGPKFVVDDDDNNTFVLNHHPKMDLIVDLHTTTSNMGTTFIINEGDALMAQAAAHVMMKCQQYYQNCEASRENVNGGSVNSDSDNSATTTGNGNYGINNNSNSNKRVQVLMHSIPDRAKRPNVASTALHGFTIEVGPVPQGVLRHDVVLKTQRALSALLEFCNDYNNQIILLQNNNDNDDNDDDSMPPILHALLKEHYPDQIVPCYQSAPAVLPGEMSGKITWPVDDEHHDFPLYMIHESRQDADFHAISTGDALFVTRDGTTVPYTGSHGDLVHLMFINEGGYYYKSSGTGIGVAVTRHYNLLNGNIVKTIEDEVEADLDSFIITEEEAEGASNDEAETTKPKVYDYYYY